MKLEVLSIEQNATNWILAGLKRHQDEKKTQEQICEEVAKELGFKFEKKEETYFFGDTNAKH